MAQGGGGKPLRLLGGHVSDGDDWNAAHRQFSRAHRLITDCFRSRRELFELCETKIKKLGLSLAGNKYVGRLNIAMNHADLMGGFEGAADLDSPFKDGREWQRLGIDDFFKGLPFEEFHNKKVGVVLTTDVKECADVWMTQGRNGLGFTLKALESSTICGKISRENLDGHSAVQACVSCAIHFAHAARPCWPQDFVRSEFCTRNE